MRLRALSMPECDGRGRQAKTDDGRLRSQFPVSYPRNTNKRTESAGDSFKGLGANLIPNTENERRRHEGKSAYWCNINKL